MRRAIVFGFLAVLVGLTAIVAGCGGGASGGGVTTTTLASVAVSGVAAASSSDLSQLGISTLAIKDGKASAAFLLSQGITAASIRAAKLVPLVTAGTTKAYIGTINASGEITTILCTAEVAANGTYTCTIEGYDPNLTYKVVVIKTVDLDDDGVADKTLEMEALLPAAGSDNAISGAEGAVSPQTTLVAAMIIEKVVKVLESASVDPDAIASVREAIIAAVDALITSGTISVNICVRDSTDSENQNLSSTVNQAATDSTVSNNLDAVSNASQIATAIANRDVNMAIGVLTDLNNNLWGGKLPEGLLEQFARLLVSGESKTVTQLVSPVNNASINMTPALDAAGLASFINTKLAQAFTNSASLVDLRSGAQSNLTDAGLAAAVVMAFPKTTYYANDTAAAVTANSSLNVAQIMVLVALAEARVYGTGTPTNAFFAHPKFMYDTGLMPAGFNVTRILGAQARVIVFENWNPSAFSPDPLNPDRRPTPEAVLAAYCEVGNMNDPNVSLSNVTVRMTYPVSGGSTATKNLSARPSVPGEQSGGFKQYMLDPWASMGSTESIVTNFARTAGLITFEAFDGSTSLGTDTVNFPGLVITAQATFESPRDVDFTPQSLLNMTAFPSTEAPRFQFKPASALPALASENHRYAYMIEIIRGQLMAQGGGMWFDANWSNPDVRVFTSWDRQFFPPISDVSGIRPDVFNIPGASNGTLETGYYEINVGLIVLDKRTNEPVSEGPRANTIFSVGTVNLPADAGDQWGTLPGTVVPSISSEVITLEGKVHTDLLTKLAANGKASLFKETQSTTGGFSYTALTGISPVVVISTPESSTPNSYRTFRLTVTGSALLSALATDGNYILKLLVWKDLDSDGVLDQDTTEMPTLVDCGVVITVYRQGASSGARHNGGNVPEGPISGLVSVFKYPPNKTFTP